MCVHKAYCAFIFPFLLSKQTRTFGHFFLGACCFHQNKELFSGRRWAAPSGEPRATLEEGKMIPDQCLFRCHAIPPTAQLGAREPRDSLAYQNQSSARELDADRRACGHHAKVTLDRFQRVSKEAAPPQDPHGAQNARRLATPTATELLTFTGPFGDGRCQEPWTRVRDFRERQCVRWLLTAVKWLHECPK